MYCSYYVYEENNTNQGHIKLVLGHDFSLVTSLVPVVSDLFQLVIVRSDEWGASE